jgi:hypothetical protein
MRSPATVIEMDGPKSFPKTRGKAIKNDRDVSFRHNVPPIESWWAAREVERSAHNEMKRLSVHEAKLACLEGGARPFFRRKMDTSNASEVR